MVERPTVDGVFVQRSLERVHAPAGLIGPGRISVEGNSMRVVAARTSTSLGRLLGCLGGVGGLFFVVFMMSAAGVSAGAVSGKVLLLFPVPGAIGGVALARVLRSSRPREFVIAREHVTHVRFEGQKLSFVSKRDPRGLVRFQGDSTQLNALHEWLLGRR